MAFTPRTLRRRKLLQRNAYVDPEVASLYHDEPLVDSSSSPLMSPVNKLTLGTPTRTRRQTDTTTTCKSDSFPNVYAPSLSLAERLNRIQYEQDTSNKRNTNPKDDGILDLQKYEMIPNKIKLALPLAGQEKLFARSDFFKEPEPLYTESTSSTPPPPPSSLSVASSPNRVSSSSSSSSPSTTTTMDDDSQGTMTPVAIISPELSSSVACASTVDDDDHQTIATSVATPFVTAPTSPTSSVISVATSISETMDIALMSWPGSPVASSAKPLYSPLSFGRVTPSHRQEPDTTTTTTTTAHPLATELTNPFLESTATTTTPPPPLPPLPESITVSKRMQQRFPHHTTMSRRQKNPVLPAPSKWHVTAIPSSTVRKPTHSSPTIRQKWIISNQSPTITPKHKVTKPTRQKIARSRQNSWEVTNNITTPASSSHSNNHYRHPRTNSLHHVSGWLISDAPSS